MTEIVPPLVVELNSVDSTLHFLDEKVKPGQEFHGMDFHFLLEHQLRQNAASMVGATETIRQKTLWLAADIAKMWWAYVASGGKENSHTFVPFKPKGIQWEYPGLPFPIAEEFLPPKAGQIIKPLSMWMQDAFDWNSAHYKRHTQLLVRFWLNFVIDVYPSVINDLGKLMEWSTSPAWIRLLVSLWEDQRPEGGIAAAREIAKQALAAEAMYGTVDDRVEALQKKYGRKNSVFSALAFLRDIGANGEGTVKYEKTEKNEEIAIVTFRIMPEQLDHIDDLIDALMLQVD